MVIRGGKVCARVYDKGRIVEGFIKRESEHESLELRE